MLSVSDYQPQLTGGLRRQSTHKNKVPLIQKFLVFERKVANVVATLVASFRRETQLSR